MKKIKIFTIIIVLLITTQLTAQPSIERQVVASTGGTWSNGSFNLDYTVGDFVVTTINNTTNYLTQGFQQPTVLTISIKEHPKSNMDISVYPNPSTDYLNIKIINTSGNISIVLFDVTGQRMFTKEYSNASAELFTTIDMKHYATGTYYLRIINSDNTDEIFRIIKF